MLTYEIKKKPGLPLYEALYRCIREDILSGVLQPGQKLPSKRALATNLEVSKITVEGAYGQLLAEGYIRAAEKVGYFVEQIDRGQAKPVSAPHTPDPAGFLWDIDLVSNGSVDFPFSVWSKLQRQIMLDMGEALLQPLPNRGAWSLRCAIAEHLAGFRGMQVSPENILIGAGTDFLYNLLIQLLGRDKIYAVEEPGYGKIRALYAAGGVKCISAPMDAAGVLPDALTNAQVLHISPSHHFPTGLVTPMGRRQELLQWASAQENRYIIEDDYDSEFRFNAQPMPTLQSLDRAGRVIYMNTFSKSLAPSIRISYMVLPSELMEAFQKKLGFYSCTVPSFEQYTLERFLSGGYFEKHINRMRKAYKSIRNHLVAVLTESPFASRLSILEQNAGLHFLLKIDTDLTDEALVQRCAAVGIRVQSLNNYYHTDAPKKDSHCLVINYSGLRKEQIDLLAEKLLAL